MEEATREPWWELEKVGEEKMYPRKEQSHAAWGPSPAELIPFPLFHGPPSPRTPAPSC